MSTFLINPSEEQEKVVMAFLDALEISFVKNDDAEKLSEHVIKGIQEGMADLKQAVILRWMNSRKNSPCSNDVFSPMSVSSQTFTFTDSCLWGHRQRDECDCFFASLIAMTINY